VNRWKRLVLAYMATGLLWLGLAATGPPIAASAGTPLPGAPNCSIFPADDVWNTPISNLPLNSQSAAWTSSMNSAATNIHFVFGPTFGMPFDVVSPSQPLVPITFQFADQSDPGPYPLSADTPIQGGPGATGDRHAIMVNPATCNLYELYSAQYSASGSTAGAGAIWNLNSNALRPAGWTSADAAGLPVLPGLVRYDEVQSGVISHAIRVTAESTDASYIWPARHESGSTSNPNLPPFGARFRLKASFNISGYSAQAQVVLRAMQQYGLILADNGPTWSFWGTSDATWPQSLVDELDTVPSSAFEAVDESSLMIEPNSGQARQLGVAINCSSLPGYRMVARDGGLFSFCEPFLGSMGGEHLNAPMVGMAATTGDGGYWEVASDGGIFNYGNATFLGSMGGQHLNAPVVGMAETSEGGGYWEVASDGGIFSFGNAAFHGSAGSLRLNKPIVGMAATPDGGGYWLVASDGGIFNYGDAGFYGSAGSLHLNKPIVGMAATPDGHGYWLVASDGGIFTYGDATFLGSRGGQPLNKPIVGMAANPSGHGYWLVASDGGIFTYGDAGFYGSTGGTALNAPIVAMG
jgi:hypothetical protein